MIYEDMSDISQTLALFWDFYEEESTNIDGILVYYFSIVCCTRSKSEDSLVRMPNLTTSQSRMQLFQISFPVSFCNVL